MVLLYIRKPIPVEKHHHVPVMHCDRLKAVGWAGLACAQLIYLRKLTHISIMNKFFLPTAKFSN